MKKNTSQASLANVNARKSNAALHVAIESLESRTLLTSVIVTSTLDKGSGTLRDAIAVANSSKTPTTITFSPTVFATPKTIVLTAGTLTFANAAEATTVTGSGAGVTISGNNAIRGIQIGPGVTATLSKLTITNCKYTSGAAIHNAGKLLLTDSTLSGNDATLNDGGGGFQNNGTATLTNDTIAKNIGAGVVAEGTTTILDCTISGNSDYARFSGAGLYDLDDAAKVIIGNSIVAGNTVAPGVTRGPDLFGGFHSLGHNLIGEANNSAGWTSTDLTGTIAKPLSAKLGALASNGGPTATMLPLAGSPAIAAGSVSEIPSGVTTDQRGLPRVVGGKVDIGAVEIQSATKISITLKAPAAQTAIVGTAKSISLGTFTESGAKAPYKATVVWGDGSANSTVTANAAGTIPTTAHTFAKTGSFTVTVSVADSASHKSNSITFKVTVSPRPATASTKGTVFNDTNNDGNLNAHEPGLGPCVVDLI